MFMTDVTSLQLIEFPLHLDELLGFKFVIIFFLSLIRQPLVHIIVDLF